MPTLTIIDCVLDTLADKAPNTRKMYAIALAHWAEYCGSSWPHNCSTSAVFQALDPLVCRRFLISLKATHSPNTCALYRAALKSIFQALEDFGLIPLNPWRAAIRGLSKSREQVRPTVLIPYDQVIALLDLPDTRTLQGLADRAMLSILFGAGLRRSELRTIRLSDLVVTPEGVPLIVLPKTKAKRTQEQPLPDWAWESVADYVRHLTTRLHAPKDSYLFSHRCGLNWYKPICSETIYRKYISYCAQLGIHAAPHSARATACTALLENGVSERDAAIFLRHSSIAMVQAYDKRSRSITQHAGLTLAYRKKVAA